MATTPRAGLPHHGGEAAGDHVRRAEVDFREYHDYPIVLLRASIGGGGQEWKSVPLPNGLKWEDVGKGGDGGYVAKK